MAPRRSRGRGGRVTSAAGPRLPSTRARRSPPPEPGRRLPETGALLRRGSEIFIAQVIVEGVLGDRHPAGMTPATKRPGARQGAPCSGRHVADPNGELRRIPAREGNERVSESRPHRRSRRWRAELSPASSRQACLQSSTPATGRLAARTLHPRALGRQPASASRSLPAGRRPSRRRRRLGSPHRGTVAAPIPGQRRRTSGL